MRWFVVLLALLLSAAAALLACGSSGGSVAGRADASAGVGAGDAGATKESDAEANDAGGDATSTSPYCLAAFGDGGAASAWVYVTAAGTLGYGTTDAGDRILDFSYAGYGGGGVAIPQVPSVQTVAPSGDGGDDTAAIQAAIDAVSALPLDGGVRGAVALAAGTFQLAGSLTIASSGVVLRGAGSGVGGTLLDVTGAPRTVLTMAGTGDYAMTGKVATITDAYVPSGARSFHVDDATPFTPGMPVLVSRPVTQAWVDFMGMNTLVRDGKPQTWIAVGTTIPTDRVVAAVTGNEVTVDVPLSDSLDARYVSPPGATVQAYTFAGRIRNVGIESLHVVAPVQVVAISAPTYTFMSIDVVEDAWVHDVVAEEFTNGIAVGSDAKRVTIEDSAAKRASPIDADAGLPEQYAIDGQQTLVQRSTAEASDMFAFATMSRAPGPNVVLAFTATGSPMHVQPHERWATGLLADGVSVPSGTIDFIDRGTDGTGHGWAIGWGVVWNGSATQLNVQSPPGAINWAIGSSGTVGTGDTGTFESNGIAVGPPSLYLAQLCERLGPGALAAIGY